MVGTFVTGNFCQVLSIHAAMTLATDPSFRLSPPR
jgi:hypothetical protein